MWAGFSLPVTVSVMTCSFCVALFLNYFEL